MGRPEPSRAENVRRAYAFAVLAMALFTVEALLVRMIGPEVNAPQVALARCAAQLAFVALWMRGALGSVFATARPGMHLWRGLFSAAGSVAYYYAFAHLPMSTATVVFFTSIIFTAALAGPVLGERVGRGRWLATIVGFCGILIVVRPGAAPMSFALGVAFFLALNAAAITLATKGLTRTERTQTIMAYIAAVTLVVNLPWAAATWTWPDAPTLALTLGIGLTGTLGQYLSIQSFRGADASGIAPVQYLRIVLAGLLGYLLFDESMDAPTVAGSLLITASALSITLAESRPPEPEPPR